MSRRSYGTGSLYVRRDSAGRETWYGQWRAGARPVKRRIGPRREPGTSNGLTKAQAERELRRKIDSERASASRERVTIAEAGERYIDHLTALGRKRATLMGLQVDAPRPSGAVLRGAGARPNPRA
jgi:hypothetical protein